MEFATETVQLFNCALNFFEFIQIARDFPKDFAMHQIKLDIIQLRLSRWGKVTEINRKSQDAQTTNQDSDRGRQAREILEKIRKTYEDAQKEANEKKPKNMTIEEVSFDPETDIDGQFKRLREKLRQALRKSTFDAAKCGQCFKWAFYRKDRFERFVREISESINLLEQLLPEPTKKKLEELSKEECEELDVQTLKTLRDAIDNCDPWLKLAVNEGLSSRPDAGASFTNQGTNYGQQSAKHNGNVVYKGCARDGNTITIH